MAVREIFKFPHPVLREKATDVTEFGDDLKKLVSDMLETMYNAKGVGLAANQIGITSRLLVLDIGQCEGDEGEEPKRLPMALVNPEILAGEGSQVDEEGCLSVIDLSSRVKRYQKIKVRAQDLEGETREFEAEDYFARVIQHEVDHLNGILFIDHLSSLKRALYKKRLKKILEEK